MRARPKTLASAAGVTVGVIAITTMAFTYEGFPTTKVDLNDGGVWITKTSSLLVGHFNHESTVLDGGLRTTGENYDILQDTNNILVVDENASTLTAVDPARVSLGDSAKVPSSAKVALGNRTAAILDQKTGELWVVPAQGVASFEAEVNEPVAELGAGADVAVAKDGTVFGLAPERGEVVTVPVDNEGEALDASAASVGELDASAKPAITAVGRTPVVLDRAAGVVTSPGRRPHRDPRRGQGRSAAGLREHRRGGGLDGERTGERSPRRRRADRGRGGWKRRAGGAGVAARLHLRRMGRNGHVHPGMPGVGERRQRERRRRRGFEEPRVPRQPRRHHPQRRGGRSGLAGEREPAARRQLERPHPRRRARPRTRTTRPRRPSRPRSPSARRRTPLRSPRTTRSVCAPV
ncbi:hypothetical protein JM654_06285 [Microbacterium oxydans]|nr:hypothetical protein [Microbacterium oxydans]